MPSLRLDDDLDALARRAAAAEGSSLSEFMRRAIAERAERLLAIDARGQLGDVVGAIHGGGRGGARATGAAFGELLAERR